MPGSEKLWHSYTPVLQLCNGLQAPLQYPEIAATELLRPSFLLVESLARSVFHTLSGVYISCTECVGFGYGGNS